MTSLKPGKGASLDLTEETLDFLQGAFEDMWNAAVAKDELEDENDDRNALNDLIDKGKSIQYLKDLRGSAQGWTPAQDTYGTKLYKSLPWNDGEMRVTVVLTKQGSLKVDVRFWFDAEGM